MKKAGLLQAELAQLVASLGHGDALVIADAGLPVPPGVRCIDLAVTHGVPGFLQVLDAVLVEMCVERALQAAELPVRSPAMAQAIRTRLAGVPLEAEPHESFKTATYAARAIVRTGECTPYANVMLFAGVVF